MAPADVTGGLRTPDAAGIKAVGGVSLAAIALQGRADSIATLMVRSADARTRTVRIRRAAVVQPRPGSEAYRLMDGNIGYVDVTRLTVPEVDAIFDALKGTRAIVFDMRRPGLLR